MTIYKYSDKFWFDFQNTIIEINSPNTTVDIQELINAIRDAEATSIGMSSPKIANASGKEDLGDSIYVGITIDLQNGWQLHFWVGNYVATISGGNLVGGPAGDPIAYSAGVQVILIQSAASTRVVTGGSALTEEEHDQLMALPDEDTVATSVWTYVTRTLTSFGTLVSDMWSAGTRTLTSFGDLQTAVEDALGIVGENVKWSGIAHDSNNNMISAVITQYEDNTLAVERKKWQLTATYDTESRLTSHELKEY